MEYSLLPSKWHCPSLGMTMPAILLSIPKCESASLTNTSKRMESFLQPILSCQGTRPTAQLVLWFQSDIGENQNTWFGNCVNLTPQTAACMMASKPHSGKSRLRETRCFAIISLKLSVLLVSGKTCLYPKVGRHVTSVAISLKNSTSPKSR